MDKMRKKYLIVTGLAVFLSLFGVWGLYLYNLPHRSVAGLRAFVKIDAAGLCAAYKRNGVDADRQFTGKVLEVRGKVVGVQMTDSTASVRLGESDTASAVNCDFIVVKAATVRVPSKGATVTIKGRCTGFLEDVDLVDCVVE